MPHQYQNSGPLTLCNAGHMTSTSTSKTTSHARMLNRSGHHRADTSRPVCTKSQPSKSQIEAPNQLMSTLVRLAVRNPPRKGNLYPCTPGCMKHNLSCGHSISTVTLEKCASNCDFLVPDFPSGRRMDEVFVCADCVGKEAEKKVKRVAEKHGSN